MPLLLEVITPKGQVVREYTELVEARSALGEIGILPGHIKYLTLLEAGEIRYLKDARIRRIKASQGFLEVVEDRVCCLVEEAEPSREREAS